MNKNFYSFLLILIGAFTINAQSTIITEWNFNDQTTNPSIGTGELSLIGGIQPWDNPNDDIPPGYSSGCDPVTLELEDGTKTGNWAYNSTGYPKQGTNSETAGFLFRTSTAGAVEEVSFIFNMRRSNTASIYFSVYSSINGTDWDLIATESNTTTNFGSYGGPYLVPNGMNAEELFIKVVSVFEPGTGSYDATGGNGYGPSGTIRLDNVRVFTGTLSLEEIGYKPTISTTVWKNDVMINAKGNAELNIYNLNGQILKTLKGSNNFRINVADLSAGVYVVKIKDEKGITTQKVVKK